MSEMSTEITAGIGRLREDLGTVARAWTDASRRVRDDATGAELLFARELVLQFGTLLQAADRMNDLAVRQASHAFYDWMSTLSHAASAPGPLEWPAVVEAHWRRRLEHLAEGASEFANLIGSEAHNVADAVFGLSRPFAAVLARDRTEPQDARRAR
jgi:hypothetical protein